MLDEYLNVMERAENMLGTQNALRVAPVFLLTKKAGSEQFIAYTLENLLMKLEDNGILFDKSNVLIPLSLDLSNQAQHGFSNRAGVFKNTLEQWILYYKIEYHAYQGFVVLDIPDAKDLKEDTAFAKKLMRQIKSNKKRFLFFILTDEEDVDMLQKLFGEMLFTEKAVMNEVSAKEYADWLCTEIKNYGMAFSETGSKKISEILKKHEGEVQFQVLDLWLKSIIWSCATAIDTVTSVDETYISEDALTKLIESTKEDSIRSSIGFF